MYSLKVSLTALIIVFQSLIIHADEGMWLPILLSDYPEAEMQRMGMKITAEDIYNANKPSIKDAIILFGGSSTAEIISDKGLLLTNYHCGFNTIQSFSSIKYNYISDGYWAKNKDEELYDPNLKVTMLISMEDVTSKVLKGTNDKMNYEETQKIINANISSIEKESAQGTSYIAQVKAFYYGNQYILIISEEFHDIRLVAAPPARIGNFGGETDNWLWPRHTGDFALFRIYAGKDNKGTHFSPSNVPYVPKKYLTISLNGAKKDDFAFIYGYPQLTQEYLPSFALELLFEIENPAAIKIRERKIEIIEKYMYSNSLIKIQYSSKRSNISNAWKKMFGEVTGIRRLNVIKQKQEEEEKFQNWANENSERQKLYGNVIPEFKLLYDQYKPLRLSFLLFREAGLGIEIIPFAYSFNRLVQLSKCDTISPEKMIINIDVFTQAAKTFFKNYNPQLDKEVFEILISTYYKDQITEFLSDTLIYEMEKYQRDVKKYSDYIYSNSLFTNEKKMLKLLSTYSANDYIQIETDPAFMLATSIYNTFYKKLSPKLSELETKIQILQKKYMKGLMEMQSDKKFYPDANGTLRISYGKIDGYELRDGLIYNYFTTLDGIMQKEDSLIEDYQVDNKLKYLWENKDYGQYADKDGRMHVCFIASMHTTGGYSGSPVLNADGNLIGLHFDRVWEGTMSDVYYDPDKCRNIAIDIRYILFIIDKYAGAKHLIDEMSIIN